MTEWDSCTSWQRRCEYTCWERLWLDAATGHVALDQGCLGPAQLVWALHQGTGSLISCLTLTGAMVHSVAWPGIQNSIITRDCLLAAGLLVRLCTALAQLELADHAFVTADAG